MGGLGKFGYGKAALLGGGALATALPFLGGKDDEEEEEGDWHRITYNSFMVPSISNIRNMASRTETRSQV